MRPNVGSQSGSCYRRRPVSQDPRIICEYNLATAISIRPLIQPRTCKMGSSIFSAMSRIKFSSTTRASFPSMPSTERIHRENNRFQWQWLPYLYLFIFSQRSHRFYSGSNLWVSASELPSLASIMASVCRPYKPQISTSTLVSNLSLLLCISPYYLLQIW